MAEEAPAEEAEEEMAEEESIGMLSKTHRTSHLRHQLGKSSEYKRSHEHLDDGELKNA